jgi:hypothetical protein
MKACGMILAVAWLWTLGAGAAVQTAPPIRPDPAAGRELAMQLCAMQPEKQVEMTGRVKIKRRGQGGVEVPFGFRILPGEQNWLAIYRTSAGINSNQWEQLVIQHVQAQPNRYLLVTRSADGVLVTNVVANPTNAFAGSDFILGDLGFEFFHWQGQCLLKKEMKSSRFCKVLESKPGPEDHALGYARVVSWVDNETGGILQAEARDESGQVLKEFDLKSFKKIQGQWQLEEMEMRNLRSRSRTQLAFDLSATP